MQEKSDAQLLRDYAECRDEAAFREIVERHTDLIYSAALRQVESADVAADIAQGVFGDLARKARLVSERLTADASLAGWLHRGTRYAALNHLRDSRRRLTNERQAMEQLLTNSGPEADWEQIRSTLDEALDSLGDEDREALLLRYFKNLDFRAVGLALGVSDDAAQKRVSRAVEHLRELFSKRGVSVGAGGLVVVISANAVQAAPAGLAATISAAAVLAGTTIATTATATAIKTIAMTTLQKTVVTATVAVLAGAGIYEARQAAQLREQNQGLQQQQVSLAEQIRQLQQVRDDVEKRLAGLLAENEQLQSNSNKNELLRLRAEVTRLKNEFEQMRDKKPKVASDPDELAAQAWVERVKLLKQRFEQWTGKATPELQLLSEQDWLNEAANHALTNDDVTRQVMADLRRTAKGKFADAINQALSEFAKSNNDQLPSDLSELKPYLQPPANSILDGYEIAKPGWVHPPQPNSPNSKNAETWALVMKGSFTSDGMAIRDGSYLADPNYDMTVVIYNGGYYGYGPDKPLK